MPMKVESAKIEKYAAYLKDKYRPPSRGGNTGAWHQHVMTIEGETYSFLARGARKWVLIGLDVGSRAVLGVQAFHNAKAGREFDALEEQRLVALRIGWLPHLQCPVGNEFAAHGAGAVRNGRRDIHMEFIGVDETPAARHFYQKRLVMSVRLQSVADRLLQRHRLGPDAEMRSVSDEVDVVFVAANRLDRRADRCRSLEENAHQSKQRIF